MAATFGDGVAFNWNRSFSEPDLTANQGQLPHSNRFTIKHPHEYIAVDDLKYFRRRQPDNLHTRSHICLYDSDEPVLPFSSLKSEYRKHYRAFGPNRSPRPSLLRRATSLRLEGLMSLLSEHQDKYHWFTPEDLKFARTYPIRNPENFLLGDGDGEMKNSSYLTYPMLDPSAKILPREMFRDDSAPPPQREAQREFHREAQREFQRETQRESQQDSHRLSNGAQKLAADKFKRDVAAQEQQKCHLQMRAAQQEEEPPAPSEYKRQYVQFPNPIEKAHSIPQMSSFKLQGDFVAVPDYQDNFKMYANYSKSAPIKKHDNLRVSGSEVASEFETNGEAELTEYRDKFNDPPKHMAKEKLLKTDDHLQPRGEFSKDVPEYNESFRDPQIKEMPERGKCREPYLRLRGKIEFNPEYRNTYLDFPRSRPIVRKPASSFRLPNSSTTSDNRQSSELQSPPPLEQQLDISTELTTTPEYRRAQYNYQIRERTPTRPPRESDGGGQVKVSQQLRKSSDSSLDLRQLQAAGAYKRRPSRQRPQIPKEPPILTPTFEQASHAAKKPARFGRRASVLQNAANCREHSSIIEGNPKYALARRNPQPQNNENQPGGSFVVLDEPCKPSNWMKKTWYDS